MITDQDITKLKTVFATKEDLADLAIEVGELKDSMDEKFTHLDVKLDRFLGRIDRLDLENAAGAVAQYRHERHINALADHVGLTLLPEE
ncbi:MAG: hypothetical protein ABIT47_01280 [Candidatus Paceibacterota bacterium]